jgi:phage terminase large subunit-like protein
MDAVDQWLTAAKHAPAGWRQRKALRESVTAEVLDALEARNNQQLDRHIDRLFNHSYFIFEPRPDDHANFDEQESFIDSRESVTVCLGGNGSGKTFCGAVRCIQFLCEQQAPPKRNTPFWIIGDTYDESCGSCWDQKLCDMFPREWVQWDKISWIDVRRNFPSAVPLSPWPQFPGRNWVLEFKSYEQGRERMQSRAIGGAWFTEQCPQDIFTEVLRGCREWMYPGSVWAEFTPVDPEKSIHFQEKYEQWSAGQPEAEGWKFCRLNTELARDAGHVSEQWFDLFFGSVSDEMQDTRKTGAFASYEGAIYQAFNPTLHTVDNFQW